MQLIPHFLPAPAKFISPQTWIFAYCSRQLEWALQTASLALCNTQAFKFCSLQHLEERDSAGAEGVIAFSGKSSSVNSIVTWQGYQGFSGQEITTKSGRQEIKTVTKHVIIYVRGHGDNSFSFFFYPSSSFWVPQKEKLQNQGWAKLSCSLKSLGDLWAWWHQYEVTGVKQCAVMLIKLLTLSNCACFKVTDRLQIIYEQNGSSIH